MSYRQQMSANLKLNFVMIMTVVAKLKKKPFNYDHTRPTKSTGPWDRRSQKKLTPQKMFKTKK